MIGRLLSLIPASTFHIAVYRFTLAYIDTFVCLRTFILLFQLAVGGGGAVLVLSELESMAARQQREIAQQRRLLEQKEARLAVLRGAQVNPIFLISIRENLTAPVINPVYLIRE